VPINAYHIELLNEQIRLIIYKKDYPKMIEPENETSVSLMTNPLQIKTTINFLFRSEALQFLFRFLILEIIIV